MSVIAYNIKQWFGILKDFYLSPFRGIAPFEKAIREEKRFEYVDLLERLDNSIRFGASLEAWNHNVEEGRERIELLFTNEVVHPYKTDHAGDEILVYTDRLDEDLYPDSVLENIKELAVGQPVRILYERSSESIKKLELIFNHAGSKGAILKIDPKLINETRNLTRFILSKNAFSEETSQEYDVKTGKLKAHKAKFFYNIQCSPSKSEFVMEAETKKRQFNEVWAELNP